jgi:hypothetical protein
MRITMLKIVITTAAFVCAGSVAASAQDAPKRAGVVTAPRYYASTAPAEQQASTTRPGEGAASAPASLLAAAGVKVGTGDLGGQAATGPVTTSARSADAVSPAAQATEPLESASAASSPVSAAARVAAAPVTERRDETISREAAP